MSLAAHRRNATRTILLDRSLEALPLFRPSDSADDTALIYSPGSGGRWRVIPSPDDRVPGTFDQDVYIELLHRYHEASCPDDGVISFTLHAFLRSIGRRVDGRTYEQLRAARSDSADDTALIYSPGSGGRWRVIPSPDDRVPGTFDQDVYIELLHRYHEASCPDDGVISFTLHAFLRSIGRRVDGRTYEQLRAA